MIPCLCGSQRHPWDPGFEPKSLLSPVGRQVFYLHCHLGRPWSRNEYCFSYICVSSSNVNIIHLKQLLISVSFKINYCHCTCFLYEMIFFRWRKSFWEYYEKLGSYLLVFLSLYSEIPCWVWTFIAKCFTKDRWRMHLRFIAERDPKK